MHAAHLIWLADTRKPLPAKLGNKNRTREYPGNVFPKNIPPNNTAVICCCCFFQHTSPVSCTALEAYACVKLTGMSGWLTYPEQNDWHRDRKAHTLQCHNPSWFTLMRMSGTRAILICAQTFVTYLSGFKNKMSLYILARQWLVPG